MSWTEYFSHLHVTVSRHSSEPANQDRLNRLILGVLSTADGRVVSDHFINGRDFLHIAVDGSEHGGSQLALSARAELDPKANVQTYNQGRGDAIRMLLGLSRLLENVPVSFDLDGKRYTARSGANMSVQNVIDSAVSIDGAPQAAVAPASGPVRTAGMPGRSDEIPQSRPSF